MERRRTCPRWLRWPWNVVIYILLAVVLRIFSIPVILVLIWVQAKYNPHGVEDGYCLSRTRKRLVWLVWALVVLFIAAALGVVFFMGLEQDRTTWETMDYVTMAVAGGGSLIFTALGIFLAFTAVRDTFFPAKSGLANSIRSQLPYPDEAPPVEELFAMVDGDLKEHGQWFDAVGIGEEWVLGDLATRIDRIRGIFVVDEIHRHHTQTGTRTSRTLQLVLIDNRWQKHTTSFSKPNELRAAADCLALRVPDAVRGINGQYSDFWTMKENEREDFEREYQQKQAHRASEQAQKEHLRGGPQDMILTCADGSVTSRVTSALVREQLRHCLEQNESVFFLTPSQPVASGGRAFRELECSTSVYNGAPQVQLLLVQVPEQMGDPSRYALRLVTDPQRAEKILTDWLERRLPALQGWELRRLWEPPQAQAQRQEYPPKLILVSAGGASQGHDTFTEEDIQVAAEGIVDGSYQMVDLTLSGGYLWIQVKTGDKTDGRCTVNATRPEGEKLHFYTTRCTHRQAASWLTAYAARQFLPGGVGWTDYTKKVEKSSKK